LCFIKRANAIVIVYFYIGCGWQTWVKAHGGTIADQNFYSSSVRELLVASTKENYTSLLQQCSAKWSPAFVEYYTTHLESDVTVSAHFATQHLGIVSLAYVGITNNVSESFNRVLKDFQNWKVTHNLLQHAVM